MRVLFGMGALALLTACSSSDPTTGGSSDGTDSGSVPGTDGGKSGGPPVSLGMPQTGDGTYYDATGAGNCSFDATPNDLDVAAMNAPQYAKSAVCGECVQVTGPKGMVTVRIVDSCPGCKSGDLDLSESAFVKIADKSAGRVKIDWQVVSCNVSGNVSYHYKDGTSQYWTAIQVRNHRLPIKSLEIKVGGAYTDVARVDYNYFVADKGAGAGPVSVRITAIDGQQLEDTLPAASSDVTNPGVGQFK
ncbi:MAG: expansin EXLX1 family cellulose-binding protein [Polyangiaceae bacterium]